MRRTHGCGRLVPVARAKQRLGQPPLAASHRVHMAVGEGLNRGLPTLGAGVVVTGRDRDRDEAAVAALRERGGNPNVDLLLADLSTQPGVRALAAQFAEHHERLDVLINNASSVSCPTRIATASPTIA